MTTTETQVREDNWAVANATVEAAVFTLAAQLKARQKAQEADRLLACWKRLEKG